MNELTEQELVQLVHRYYPTGSFVASDSYTQNVPPYTRTPEYQRWMAAWKRAMDWKEWELLLEELDTTLDGVGDVTQPSMAACRRCAKSVKQSPPGQAQQVTRVVAAVSVLAPLYITYCTTETIGSHGRPAAQHFSFEPTNEARSYAEVLASTVERVLGYRPFPLHLADVRVPGVFVPHLDGAQATLLFALFDQQLHNLP
jgi:hypothetical protein